jgi:hypothetical protein
MKNLLIGLMLLSFSVMADEVSSIRDSQYEWQCETQNGVLISGHTRQDKAFQSCMNRALADGQMYIVRGGTYRVTASISAPPIDPPPIDPPPVPCEWDDTIPADDPGCVEPPIDPPPVDPVNFGPATAIIQYPAEISAFSQEPTRWQITFTLNSVGTIQGLVSRDQYGTNQPGHLSVWIETSGVIHVRNQGADGQVHTVLQSQTVVVPGVEYVVDVSIDTSVGIGLFVNGVFEDSSTVAYGQNNNDLPLVLAGRCSRCTADGVTGPDMPIDGVVELTIWDTPLQLPEPIVGSHLLRWTLPTEYDDDTALPPGVPDKISIYNVNPRRLVADLDGESIMYEVTNLSGGEHCWVATAWDGEAQSIDSNQACAVITGE